jgi:hypothetical protein
LWRGSGADQGSSGSAGRPSSATSRRNSPPGVPTPRQSNGLEQFFTLLRDRGSLGVMDFSGVSQENISFITNMGHRFASEDFLRALENTFGEDGLRGQSDPVLVDQFVSENLSIAPDSLDGVLLWDSLQFLSPHLLQLTVDRLYEAMRPDGCMLAFFNADEKQRTIPVYQYRIADLKTVNLIARGEAPAGQYFNNRSIEKLFQKFQSVKFFLARDHLREIIVRR